MEKNKNNIIGDLEKILNQKNIESIDLKKEISLLQKSVLELKRETDHEKQILKEVSRLLRVISL